MKWRISRPVRELFPIDCVCSVYEGEFQWGAVEMFVSSDIATGDAHFFDAAQAMAQGLSQWAMLIIGGSLAVIIGDKVYRPKARRIRATYLLFAPAWILLALSIYEGTYIQRSYVAYMVATRGTHAQALIDQIAGNITQATRLQLSFLETALGFLAIWLFFYLIWWVIRND